ncbi:hypothetical protein SAMN02745716_1281 [Thermoleophilum album]|uniref:Uncharacterized protein n=1 Tax=Thermoleophilum album TaxID=29539 RepID=A0A1H6FTM3_THEAL|nr:hypothetical protein SAMN02745716_1281 [Thermoleophilum album]
MHGTTATSGRCVRRGYSAVLRLLDAGTLGVGLAALAAGLAGATLAVLTGAPASERAAELAAAAAWVLWGGRPPARSRAAARDAAPPAPGSAAGRLRWSPALRMVAGSLLALICALSSSNAFAARAGTVAVLDVVALALGAALGCLIALEAAREGQRSARLAAAQSALDQREQGFASPFERKALKHPTTRALARGLG